MSVTIVDVVQERKGTAVIFEFSSSFDSNYATFKSNDSAPISLQCCGGLGRILKGGRGSNFAAGVIAAQRHRGRFNFTLRAQNYIWFCRLHCLGPPPTPPCDYYLQGKTINRQIQHPAMVGSEPQPMPIANVHQLLLFKLRRLRK